MTIAVIHGNDGSDVRIGKICRSLSRLGHDVHFIGWDRRPQTLKVVDLGQTSRHMLTWRTSFGRGDVMGYLKFAQHIVRTLAWLRPDAVHCVNEDFALLVLPVRGILFDKLICDVFDALADRHSHRGRLVRGMTQAVSELVRGRADRLIATDDQRFNRFGRHRAKTLVVENVPEDPGEGLAARMPRGPARIYVTGSLSGSRGLEQVLAAVEQTADVRIVSAGWPFDAYAADVFIKHPRVQFQGIIDSRRSLELASSCDAVFAFYAPTSRNNLQASPNKLYDALSVGRPLIVNSEIRISNWIAERRLGWCCGYSDRFGLMQIIRQLPAARRGLPEFAARARRIYTDGHTWAAMESRLAKLYDGHRNGF